MSTMSTGACHHCTVPFFSLIQSRSGCSLLFSNAMFACTVRPNVRSRRPQFCPAARARREPCGSLVVGRSSVTGTAYCDDIMPEQRLYQLGHIRRSGSCTDTCIRRTGPRDFSVSGGPHTHDAQRTHWRASVSEETARKEKQKIAVEDKKVGAPTTVSSRSLPPSPDARAANVHAHHKRGQGAAPGAESHGSWTVVGGTYCRQPSLTQPSTLRRTRPGWTNGSCTCTMGSR